jgi:large subunit ribosomal protein L23
MINLIPHKTEKSFALSSKNTYAFVIDGKTSKQEIKRAIEAEFKVSVISVRVLVRPGKATRFSRGKHAYPGTTYKADKKIAYITLKDGDKIKIFEEEEIDTGKPETMVKKSAKASDATTPTETKKAGLFTRRRTGNRGDK